MATDTPKPGRNHRFLILSLFVTAQFGTGRCSVRQGNFLRFIFKNICSRLLNSSCIGSLYSIENSQITLRDRELHRSSLRIVGKTDTAGCSQGIL